MLTTYKTSTRALKLLKILAAHLNKPMYQVQEEVLENEFKRRKLSLPKE